MKSIFSLFLALILILMFSISTFSVVIDGVDSGSEWDNATAYTLINGNSNCGIEFGAVKVKFDAPNNVVLLCFMFIDPKLEQGNSLAGVSVSVENSHPFVINMISTPQNVDIDRYHIDGAMSIDQNNGASCEMKVGIKSGLPRALNVSVRFFDAIGEPSNNYEFTLINEEYVETTDIVISPTKDNDDPIYNPDLLTQKITKEQTVKPYITVKKKTTTKPTERTRWALKDSPYTYTGRTKRNETKPALQTIVVPAITVYYYEKEIIISHVYISEPNVSVSEAKTEITSVVATTEISSQTSAESTQRYLSKGSKYKAVSVLGGGAAFAVIAVLGVANVNKKSKNEDETKN